MTHGRTRRKRPAGPRLRSERAVSPGCGRCWVRTNEGLADGFTARSLHPSNMPLTCAYALRGGIPGRPPSAICPCAANFEAVRATDGGANIHGQRGGSGYADRPARFLAADLPFQDACSLSSLLSSPRSNWRSGLPRASLIRLLGASRLGSRCGHGSRLWRYKFDVMTQ
jgi:hypothetical protein